MRAKPRIGWDQDTAAPVARLEAAASRVAGSNLRIILLARASMSVPRATTGVITALYLASLGFTAVRIGALFAWGTITSAVFSSAIGLIADLVGRTPFLVAAVFQCLNARLYALRFMAMPPPSDVLADCVGTPLTKQ